jgi:glycosyltransferase involved in cell wall biosynthesis
MNENFLSITVVMPAYNEEAGISQTVKGFLETGLVNRIIVVDNNSTDLTRIRALEAGAEVIVESRQGYGYACKTGLDNVNSEIAVLTESDNSFEPSDIKKIVSYLTHFDMVNGARTDSRIISKDADWTLPYRLANYVIAKFMQFIYLDYYTFKTTGFHEVGGTFRAFNMKTWKKISPLVKEGKSAFLPEITTIYLRKNMKVIEIPVSYRARLGVSKISGSRLKAARLAMRMIKIIIINRFRKV